MKTMCMCVSVCVCVVVVVITCVCIVYVHALECRCVVLWCVLCGVVCGVFSFAGLLMHYCTVLSFRVLCVVVWCCVVRGRGK